MTQTKGPRQVPPPQRPIGADGAPVQPNYARFIPREEVQSFAAWSPESLTGRGEARASAAPAAPPPPTEEEQRAALRAARQSGYQDGYRDGLVALDGFKQSFATQMTAQLGTLVANFDAQFDRLQQKMAESLARSAVELARQVVRQSLKQQPELVAAIAREAVGELLLSARHVTVQVHPDDLPLVAEGAGEELERRGARLVPDASVSRGGCRVDSDLGSVDATIETRWRAAAASLGDDSPLGEAADERRPLTLRHDDMN